jgi:hypothetical protein
VVEYRLFFISGERHFEGALVIIADDDEAAISLASTETRCGPMELWSGARLVREWTYTEFRGALPGRPVDPSLATHNIR